MESQKEKWQNIAKVIIETEADLLLCGMSADEIHGLRRSSVEWFLNRQIGQDVEYDTRVNSSQGDAANFLSDIRVLIAEKFPGADVEDIFYYHSDDESHQVRVIEENYGPVHPWCERHLLKE